MNRHSILTNAQKIINQKAKRVAVQKELVRISEKNKELNVWKTRVSRRMRDNAQKQALVKSETTKFSKLEMKAKVCVRLVEDATELVELQQELEFLETQAANVRSKISEKFAEIQSADFDPTALAEIMESSASLRGKLRKKCAVPNDESGRTSLALCSKALRLKIWEREMLRSRTNPRDPLLPGNEYRETEFRLMVRGWGWNVDK